MVLFGVPLSHDWKSAIDEIRHLDDVGIRAWDGLELLRTDLGSVTLF